MPDNRHAWLIQLFDSGEHITHADATLQGRHVWFDALIKENALVHSGNASHLLCPQCDEPHDIAINPTTFKGYCVDAGHVSFEAKRIMQYQASAAWLIETLRKSLGISGTDKTTDIIANTCWKIGAARLEKKLRPIFLCRGYEQSKKAVNEAVTALADETGIILLTSPHQQNPEKVFSHRAVAMTMCLSDEPEKTFLKADVLERMWNNQSAADSPLTYSADYLNQRDERGNSVIVVDQLRAPLLKRMFTEYASGAYTLGQMQQRCKEWGLRSKAGVELHKSTLYRIVQNPFYYGDMLIKGEIMQHCHEPLVSRNVWEDCQAVLRGWEKKPFLYGGKDFLFRGLLTCAVTGRVVSSDTKKKSYKNGTTAEFTYLVTWNPENPSKKFWVREDKVAAQVEAALERITIKDHEMMTAAIAAVKEANKAKQESHNREVGLLKKEHSEIQAKLDRLVDLLAEGVLPPEDYRTKREQLKKRQHDLVNLIHAYDDADNMFGSTMEKLMKVAMGAHKAFLSSSVEEKRELLNFVFSNLTLKGETLCYSYNFPFNNFENLDDCSKWRRG